MGCASVMVRILACSCGDAPLLHKVACEEGGYRRVRWGLLLGGGLPLAAVGGEE